MKPKSSDKSCTCSLCEKRCQCDAYAIFFSALGNTSRLHIINALRKGPKNVGSIVEITGLEQTCVSHCLKLLEKHGFVTSKRDGKFRVYTVNRKTIEPLMRMIDDHVVRYCKTS